MRTLGSYIVFSLFALLALAGCAGHQKAVQQSAPPSVTGVNREAALDHYLNGLLLDQKEDYPSAILEYQDALRYDPDPAIYHDLAKDYSILGKNALAVENAREAVRLSPSNRTYRETLAEICVRSLDVDRAIGEYQNITKLDPDYQQAWYNLARLLQIRDRSKALEVFQKIVDRFGPDPDALNQIAQTYTAMRKYDKALAALKEMLKLDPTNTEMKKNLADTYLLLDSADAALRVYQDILEDYPDNILLRASIAHAYLLKGDRERAIGQCEIVMSRDSASVEDQIRFGQVFATFVEKDSTVAPVARQLFQQIQQRHPNDWRPYWVLGAIANIMKDDSGAAANFKVVTKLANWNADGWVGVASVLFDRGDVQQAIDILEEAKKYVPNEYRIYFLLGISYQRQHQDIEAVQALERAITMNENSVDAIGSLAMVYNEMQRYEQSDSLYERALKLDPNNHLILNNYGYSLSERGLQLERALEMSKRAVDQQPTNQSYLDTKGWIYFRLGQYREAEQLILKAIELGSKSPVLHEHLGDVYYKMNQKVKALEFWRKALEFDRMNQRLIDKVQRGTQ